MADILNIFSRLSSNVRRNLEDKVQLGVSKARPKLGGPNLQLQDVGVFEVLGENQQSIDFALASVLQGMSGFQAMFGQLTAIRADLGRSFDEQRNLARVSSAVKQERDHALQRFTEKCSEYDLAHAELLSVRIKVDELQRNFDRAHANFEGLEHRHHMLGVAKRETDDALSRSTSQLGEALDELEARQLEASSLRELLETNNTRIGELTIRCTDAGNNALMLSNRCETLEGALQQKVAELVEITDRFDLVYQEKEAAIHYSQQKEQDAAHARAEMGRVNQQFKQEKKSREFEIQQLKSECGESRARVKTLEEVNGEAVAENERLVATSLKLKDELAQVRVACELLDGKVERQNAKLASLINAKSQLEQSRATMAARLEAVTQALSDRENDVKRLNAEVALLSAQVEKQSGLSSDNIEALATRVFELEKELAAQCNETAFYESQLVVAKQSVQFAELT